MNYVNKFNLLGVEARQRPMLTGAGVPDSTTPGDVGELYMDTDTGRTYKCINDTDGVYVWESTTKDVEDKIGDISAALDELHTYAQALIDGGAE